MSNRAIEDRASAEYNIAEMRILAVETVTRAGSLALFDGTVCHASEGDPAETHGARLPGEAVRFALQHGHRLSEIDVFAIVAGPGSFTGLRVGMAAVQGMALPAGKRVVGIPTLEAIASGWLDASNRSDLLVACLDGQRGDVFYAMYDVSGAGRIEECRVLLEASVARPEEAAAQIASVRNDRPLSFVGDRTFAHDSAWAPRLPNASFAPLPVTLAEAAARLALRRVARAVNPHALRPLYVRRPDAELARARSRIAAGAAAAPAEAPGSIVRVRDAADVTAVEDLQRRSFTQAWGADALRWELEKSDVARLYLMRAPTGEPVAYCACWVVVDELHINSLAVDEDHRRRGLARHLLAHVLADAVSEGARSATLEVRESNRAARALYEGFGFRVEGVRRGYYQTPVEDALVLWRRDLELVGRDG